MLENYLTKSSRTQGTEGGANVPSPGATLAFSRAARKQQERTCVVCQATEGAGALVRVVRTPEGELFPDLAQKLPGRGAWIHPTVACLAKSNAGFSRSFQGVVRTTAAGLTELLAQGALAQADRYLGAARRQSLVCFGADAVTEAWGQGSAELVLVAQDARAAAEIPAVRDAVGRGRARVFRTKVELGRLFGKEEVGVLAVLDKRLAKGLFDAIAMSQLAPQGKLSQPSHGTEARSDASASNRVSLEDGEEARGERGPQVLDVSEDE